LPNSLLQDSREFFSANPNDYLADPAYSGPGDLVDLVNQHFGITDMDIGPNLSAKVATEIQMLTQLKPHDRDTPGRLTTHVNDSGENSLVLESSNLIRKLTPPYKDTQFEAFILRELTVRKQQSRIQRTCNVETPDFLFYEPDAPSMFQQLGQSRVGGEKLSNDEVRNFSKAERRALGQKLGRFVAYMAEALPRERYDEILEQAGSPILFDRGELIKDYFTYIQLLEDKHRNVGFQRPTTTPDSKEMHPTLVKMLLWLKDTHEDLEARDLLCTPIIAHDDLRPAANLTFRGPKGKRRLRGVIDFEYVRPMAPERALRHIVPLGKEAINAAEEGYGQPLCRELLEFWATGQWVTTVAAYEKRLPETQELLDDAMFDLRALQPKRDWRGLAPTR